MIITLPIPDKALNPNARIHPLKKSPITKAHRQRAFFATLKALGLPTVPSRILQKDRRHLGILHNRPLRNADYQKIALLLYPGARPTITRYTLAFHYETNRGRDDDNSGASCKAYRDGIADALLTDDHHLTMHQPPKLFVDKENPRLEIILF